MIKTTQQNDQNVVADSRPSSPQPDQSPKAKTNDIKDLGKISKPLAIQLSALHDVLARSTKAPLIRNRQHDSGLLPGKKMIPWNTSLLLEATTARFCTIKPR